MIFFQGSLQQLFSGIIEVDSNHDVEFNSHRGLLAIGRAGWITWSMEINDRN